MAEYNRGLSLVSWWDPELLIGRFDALSAVFKNESETIKAL